MSVTETALTPQLLHLCTADTVQEKLFQTADHSRVVQLPVDVPTEQLPAHGKLLLP